LQKCQEAQVEEGTSEIHGGEDAKACQDTTKAQGENLTKTLKFLKQIGEITANLISSSVSYIVRSYLRA
jgi:hypothetical protein